MKNSVPGDKSSFKDLRQLMALLRSPEGCPWDREQTPQSIKNNLLEETCEVIDAIENKSGNLLKEELGDLLLQIVFQAQMAEEKGEFTIDDVITGIVNKLKHRHPHIFGDLKLTTSTEVLHHWEEIKTKERENESHLNSVPRSLPALALAQKMQNKAARVGFDWPETPDIIEKLAEEIKEFISAKNETQHRLEEEFGDILFTLVNMGRHLGIDCEMVLRQVTLKFEKRFTAMETLAKSRDLNFIDLTLAEKEKLWHEVKEKNKF